MNAAGRMDQLYCKVCGVLIGAETRQQFKRFRNYAEMKMKFSDGSMHVTNGCKTCINLAITSADLRQAMHIADIDDMVKTIPSMEQWKHREKPRSIAIDTHKRGII